MGTTVFNQKLKAGMFRYNKSWWDNGDKRGNCIRSRYDVHRIRTAGMYILQLYMHPKTILWLIILGLTTQRTIDWKNTYFYLNNGLEKPSYFWVLKMS